MGRNVPGNGSKQKIHGLRRGYLLISMLFFCTVFYYFGELVDLAGLESLRLSFFYSVHDVHRLLFLAPIIYAGYTFGARSVVITTILAVNIMLPRALLISPFPDPLLRMFLFIIIAGTIGYLTALVRQEASSRRHYENLLHREGQDTLRLLRELDEPAAVIGPDYRVHFANPSMVRQLGEPAGQPCNEYLCGGTPCGHPAGLPASPDKEGLECSLRDYPGYRVLALPFTDTGGEMCRLVIFYRVPSAPADK